MKIIQPRTEILTEISEGAVKELRHIERVGRTSYKSEDKITNDSCYKFIKMLINNGHESAIEHSSLCVKFIVDRGVSHEIVRHRLSSFTQESTVFCNYGMDKFDNEITVIDLPRELMNIKGEDYEAWHDAMVYAEYIYLKMVKRGANPRMARSVLPNSIKTELVMTANYREWRHFLKLRTESHAHPQMRQVCIPLLKQLQALIPVVFDDIEVEEMGG